LEERPKPPLRGTEGREGKLVLLPPLLWEGLREERLKSSVRPQQVKGTELGYLIIRRIRWKQWRWRRRGG